MVWIWIAYDDMPSLLYGIRLVGWWAKWIQSLYVHIRIHDHVYNS